MMGPLVSIITPCHNGEKHVHRLLKSILIQTYDNIEFIFIDDGSEDNTKKVIMSYEKEFIKRGFKLHYIYQRNKGQAAALNVGLKTFQGDYFTWPDSDDYMEKDCIYQKVMFLENNFDYGLVRSDGFFIDENNQKSKRKLNSTKQQSPFIFEELLMEKISVIPVCYMARTSIFLDSYPHRHIYESRSGQNFQLLLPISSRSKCGYINKDLYYIYARNDSHSRKTRSFEERLHRINNIESILLNTLPYCNCDNEKYANLIKDHYSHKRFILAIKENNIALLCEQYQTLKRRKIATRKDARHYYRVRYKLIDIMYKKYPGLIRLLKNISS